MPRLSGARLNKFKGAQPIASTALVACNTIATLEPLIRERIPACIRYASFDDYRVLKRETVVRG